jgi:Acetyltransferase (GNAT) domain
VEPHLCLFNTEAYHSLYLQPPQEYVRIDYHDAGRLVGTCAGVLENGVFDCGHRAPFGGIDISGDYQPPGKVAGLVGHLLNAARVRGARKIRIHCRPHYLSPSEAAMHFALLAQGFQVESAELSQGIELSAVPNMEVYVEGLRSPGRRALRHSMDLGLQAAVAEHEAEWAEGFRILEMNRAERGVTLKYSLAYLHRLRALFPGQIRMLLLRHDSSAVAAALVYRVFTNVHYVAAWGDAGHQLPYSPMNYLAHQVVEKTMEDGAHVVDLGISSVDGVVNDGLVQFKRNIGASTGLRLDLVCDL